MASSSNLSRKRKSITDYFSVFSANKSNAVAENVTIQSVSNSTVVAEKKECHGQEDSTSKASSPTTDAVAVCDFPNLSQDLPSDSTHDISIAFAKLPGASEWKLNRQKILSDQDKDNLLSNHVAPPKNFNWSFGVKKNQKVYLAKTHLSGKNSAFKFSMIIKGVVCISCALFSSEESSNNRGKVTALQSFVTSFFVNYKKIHDKLKAHLCTKYHDMCQTQADAFLKCQVAKTQDDILKQLDAKRKETVIENRKRLLPILKTVILCRRLGLSLRGHRDNSNLEPLKAVNGSEGNFRALLSFRVESGDAESSEHLKTASKKATYISKEIENKLIELCGQEILQKIIQEIHAVTFFSVIADETSDSSHVEQLCLYLRYVSEDCVVKQQFISFGSIKNCTAQGISNEILARLANLELPIENCVGQGYDGASVMAGYKGGVQAFIREKAPSAIYVHCASHALNLVLNHGSDVIKIRNMFKIVSDTINFANDSPKRRALFDTNLTKMCETRFVQRHDSILKFGENLQKIKEGLAKS